MRKSLIVAVTAALAVSALAPAHAQRGYNNNYNRGYNNNNGWNYAAAAVGGALVGALVGSALTPSAPMYAPPVYGGPVYAPPGSYGVPVIAPGACVAVRVPQYNQYGQLVQYVQTCAN